MSAWNYYIYHINDVKKYILGAVKKYRDCISRAVTESSYDIGS